MATRRYGVSRGEGFDSVVTEAVGAATSSDDIELTVDLAVSLTKEEVVKQIESITAHIVDGDWPPA